MSIKIGPDSDVRPWNKAGQDERRSELSGLALYYFDMHHFYGNAVELLFKIGGKDVAVSEVEYLESKTDYYLEKYEAELFERCFDD